MPNFLIKNDSVLKKLLWLDTAMGGVTACLGLFFSAALTDLLGLPTSLIVVIATITLAYAVLACTLAMQQSTAVAWLRLLVNANWVWTAVSAVLFVFYYGRATR